MDSHYTVGVFPQGIILISAGKRGVSCQLNVMVGCRAIILGEVESVQVVGGSKTELVVTVLIDHVHEIGTINIADEYLRFQDAAVAGEDVEKARNRIHTLIRLLDGDQ